MAVCLPLAWLSDNQSYASLRINGRRNDRIITVILILILGFFSGLRTWGNDTVTYQQIYDLMPSLEHLFDTDKYNFAGGTGFGLLTCLLKTWGFSRQDYFMFYAFATIIPWVLFIRKHSTSMLFGFFLLFTTGLYTFSMAAVKQCMATAFCLLSVDAALEHKWLRYLLSVALASLFHPYALIYLTIPFLFFKPWTARTFVYSGIFIAAGFLLESLLGKVLDITDMIGASYDMGEFTGEGVNIFRVLVCFVPMILAAYSNGTVFRNSTRKDDLMFNMAMINGLIMFVGMFGTANYFARLANYFLPAQIITIPWLLKRFPRRERNWLIAACLVGYMGFFYYEYGLLRPFDSTYSQMSFWQYLSSLFGGGAA